MGEPIEQAIDLLSQQIWCWGRDILRPEGNWLLEIGFDRLPPPADHEECASLYSLTLPGERCVILRGFGVFYGNPSLGGVFLPRYEFCPRYTPMSSLACSPWTSADMPELELPNDEQRDACIALTLELIQWIRSYEVGVVENLGIAYRESSLIEWNNGDRKCIPAEQFASAWRELSLLVAANFTAYSESHAS